jgi:hypothetical protein
MTEDPRIDTDGKKLRTLAEWLDVKDDAEGFTGDREVQRDLRRIADRIDLTDWTQRGGQPT